jgi:hypothetical protein
VTDPVTIVEQRGQAAWKNQAGPNYRQIVRDVAAEHNMTYDTLREACLERWTGQG